MQVQEGVLSFHPARSLRLLWVAHLETSPFQHLVHWIRAAASRCARVVGPQEVGACSLERVSLPQMGGLGGSSSKRAMEGRQGLQVELFYSKEAQAMVEGEGVLCRSSLGEQQPVGLARFSFLGAPQLTVSREQEAASRCLQAAGQPLWDPSSLTTARGLSCTFMRVPWSKAQLWDLSTSLHTPAAAGRGASTSWAKEQRRSKEREWILRRRPPLCL